MNTNLINQANYIKILLTNNRMTEALQFINKLQNDVKNECASIIDNLENSECVYLTKRELNVSPGNTIQINGTWVTLINTDKKEKTLELDINGIDIKVKYITL